VAGSLAVRPVLTLSGADEPASDTSESGRTADANDSHKTFARPRLLRDTFGLPCRAIREGWTHAAIDAPTDFPPEAA
jgi:hypothetical protein